MNAPMLHAMTPPLAPFVDALPLPSRLIAAHWAQAARSGSSFLRLMAPRYFLGYLRTCL